MKILVIDNYDSFTYNLVQLLGNHKIQVVIRRNDEVDAEQIDELHPDKILISPGPGIPENSNASLTAYREFGKTKQILGVCLGHQAMGVVYGGKVIKAPVLMHGKISVINHDNKTLFKKIPQRFEATRYHSLIVDRESLPECLEISAETDDGIIMGIRHKNYPVEGIQFHPESILTREGKNIINNWLSL
ncbi:MAG: aminodeoxychorismate/anthranilate synthase component II [Ignavibacteriaceae bacterium]